MSSDVYIFGYQSILAAGSLATSIGASEHEFTPTRLAGYFRRWSAVRDFRANDTKRYVHTDDWRIANRVAFATIEPCPGKLVNGICARVPESRLPELDFREQGYTRIDVSGSILPYGDYEIDRSLRCFTYVDPAPDPLPTMVSQAYYDMGRVGAASIDEIVPDFLEDYLTSTEVPAILADDLAFVFFSGDGQRLWLLDESNSSLVLLHQFAHPQFPPLTREPPEILRHVTSGLEWLDARHRAVEDSSTHKRIPSGLVKDLTLALNGNDVSASPYWLCRLTATDVPLISSLQLEVMENDPDHWVRRAARSRRSAL
jgi:hypothetical protein